jgi:peptidoglycan hydrolase-like protein with peptidoglycan-binding domain
MAVLRQHSLAKMSSRGAKMILAACLYVGCAAEEPDPDSDAITLERLGPDLTMGSRGGEVRAVNQYRVRYGYFPNDQLRRDYPNWRPLVAQLPAQPDVFDASTADGIRALQRTSSLPPTGIVDAATRALLGQSRCAVPEGIELGDGSEKFALNPSAWSQDVVTWKVMNGDFQGEVSVEQTREVAANLFLKWSVPTKYTFFQMTSGPTDIVIEFAVNKAPNVPFTAKEYGIASSPSPDGAQVRLNTGKKWSVANPTPSDSIDLYSVLIHEIGHAIGLAHSGIVFDPNPNPGSNIDPAAVMHGQFPPPMQRRTLTPDDHVAGLTRALKWGNFDTATDDVAVRDHVGGQTIFVTGGASVPGGREIWRRDNLTWSKMPGGAVRIAANRDMQPWVVNDIGEVYSWNAVTNVWDLKAGTCAKDIGIGANPNDPGIWVVSCTPAPGGFATKRLLGSTWVSPRDGKGAVRISVGPRSPAMVTNVMNVPWITDNTGKIFRANSSDPTALTYEELPGLGNDIAVSGSGYAWLISVGAIQGGFTIYSWAEQPAADGSPPAPRLSNWIRVTGGAINIAASWSGYPIVANNQRSAYAPL